MDRREQMRKWLARRERLGLTLRELSVETGVPVGTLGHWAWKLRRESSIAPRSGPRTTAFVELVTDGSDRSPTSGACIEVLLAGGRRLLIPDGIDEDQISRVVRALERC